MNEETFKEAAGPYNAALKENGHNYTLNYTPNHNRHDNSKANTRTEEHHETEPKHTGCQNKREKHKNKENNMVQPLFQY